MRHVVWDWNGTLLADQHVVIDAVNSVLADAGLGRIDAGVYQRHYTRPVHRFYERLFGRPLGREEWERLDAVYHAAYRAGLAEVALADDATPALEAVAAGGGTQSLLSMWRHDELVPLVEQLGIAGHFVRVDGLRGGGGGRKAAELARHLRELGPRSPAEEVVVIGDALDDAHAAASVGARAILYDGGSHPRSQLEAAGVPVATSLLEALAMAGIAVG